jgi:hypothetical protein
MSRETILSLAVETGRAIVRNDVTKGDLANQLLQDMVDAIDARYPIEIVWADMARAMGYSDKAAKIDGLKMPGSLATYRSLHRKALGIVNGDMDELRTMFSMGHADLKKLVYGKPDAGQPVEDAVQPVEVENEPETESAVDFKELTSVVIPRGIAEIMERYERLRVADAALAAKFIEDMNATAKAWKA